jgi:flagellar assembly protein FliH
MVSLFDLPTSSGNLPVDLVAQGARGITLLEFFPVAEVNSEAAASLPGQDAADSEGREEVDAEHSESQARAAMIDAAREQTEIETRAICELEMESRMADERKRVMRVCEEFARDRKRYFAAAEAQVVKLALALARRVLAQEAKSDALHLLPIVRAALGRVQDGSVTTMRVATGELQMWKDALASEGSLVIYDDEHIAAGEPVLETSVGRVELGIEPQMQEMERGFDELLQRGAA